MSPYPPIQPQNGHGWMKKTHHDTYPEIDPITQSDCTGKAVFITGASKGIGQALAVSYAKAGAAHIAIGARTSLDETVQAIRAGVKAANRPDPQILSFELDVCERASVAAAAAQTEEAFGRLDILVNNAGYLSLFKPLIESDEDEWWKTFEVNVRAVYWVTKAFLPLLLKGGDKTVLNLSSIGAMGLRPGASAYQTTKHAVLRLTEFNMVDYGDQGILSYSIHPGGVMTNMGQRMPEHLKSLLIDTPELAGDAMVWLTQRRREWLAGRYISVCWDMPELMSREKEIVDGDLLKMRMRF